MDCVSLVFFCLFALRFFVVLGFFLLLLFLLRVFSEFRGGTFFGNFLTSYLAFFQTCFLRDFSHCFFTAGKCSFLLRVFLDVFFKKKCILIFVFFEGCFFILYFIKTRKNALRK